MPDTTNRRAFLRWGAAVVTVSLAGCNDDGSGDGTATSTPGSNDQPTSPITGTPTATLTPTSSADEMSPTPTSTSTTAPTATSPTQTPTPTPMSESADGPPRLAAADADSEDGFGSAVALDGDTALIGAANDEDPNGDQAGAAYVFTRTNDKWHQEAKLVPTDGDSGDRFGLSVALDGDTALVGAPRDEHPNGTEAGAAYVFERTDSGWRQHATLAAADGDSEDRFGVSVALDTDTALVGAKQDEHPNGDQAGAAYVFVRESGEWRQQAKLAPDDGRKGAGFGFSVALLGGTALVGAPGHVDRTGHAFGAAYVFERSDTAWSQEATLTVDGNDPGDGFGWAVGVAPGTALVGSPLDGDPNGTRAGSAYAFERANGGWNQPVKLAAEDGDSKDFFGAAVAVADGTALIGTPNEEDPNGTKSGAAYVFEGANDGWRQGDKLTVETGDSKDGFGWAIALAGELALIGAPGDEIHNESRAGAAYVFTV